jgi:signal transduction histidine kinase
MRVGLKASRDAQEAWSAALEQRVAERTRELRRLTRQILSAQEDERRRVARELHDETSQLVAALAIRLDSLSVVAAGDEAMRLRDLRALVERMHEALHRVIANLRPSVLDDLGLAAAIEWLAEAQLSRQGIAVRCELRDLRDLRLAPDIETAAFRIVQEAITNVSRHAGADTVLIQGSRSDGWITIEIEDDGCGFRPEAVVASAESLRGIGLLGMRERVQLVGGKLVIDSAPGQGTRVALTVPIMEETAP